MFIATICGRLARDPELRTAGNTQLCTFTVAVDQGYGERKRGVFWRCKAFGKSAEFISGAFAKGKPIFASGRLEEELWTDKQGVERKDTILIVDHAAFVPRESQAAQERQPQRQTLNEVPESDDIPF